MNKIDTENIIVAEYNGRQRVFNVCTLSWAIQNNREFAEKGVEGGFIIIGAFGSYDEAEAACEEMQHTQDRYEDEFGFGYDRDDEGDELYEY